jgi:hypothetical protein
MKHICFFLMSSFLSMTCNAQLDQLRNAFFAASGTDGINSFYLISSQMPDQNAVEIVYHGVATAMRAEVMSGVSDKLKTFSDGKELIESAVKLDFYNPEIRFLRFSVQSQIPFFLGYSSEKENDINVIIYALEHRTIDSNSAYWQRVLQWLQVHGDLAEAQLKQIRNFILQ